MKMKLPLRKILWAVGENAFLLILALFSIGGLICLLLFYLYVLPAKVAPGNVLESALKFRKDVFQQVLEEWKTNEERLSGADALAPRDIFRYSPIASP